MPTTTTDTLHVEPTRARWGWGGGMNAETIRNMLGVANGDPLDRDGWTNVVADLVEHLEEHLGEKVEVDPSPAYYERSFSVWLWRSEPGPDASGRTWSGVLGGDAIDPDLFEVTFTQFLFNAADRQRIRTPEGTCVVHGLWIVPGKEPTWSDTGWQPDEFDEWEDVPFPEE